VVHGDDAVQRGADDPGAHVLRGAQALLGADASDVLAHLPAERAEEVDLLGVDRTYLAREELHDAQDAVGPDDRQADRGVEPGVRGHLDAREVGVVSDLDDPRRLARRPHAAGQPDARPEGEAAVEPAELVERRLVEAPVVGHAQQGLAVSANHSAPYAHSNSPAMSSSSR
jgi:hypothetical protein